MPLLATLDKTAFETLDDVAKKFYKADGEAFTLDIETSEIEKLAAPVIAERDALKAERDKLATNNKSLLDEKVKVLEKLKSVEESAGAEITEKAKAEIEALKASMETAIKGEQERAKALQSQLMDAERDRTIAQLTTEFNLVPELAKHVLKDYIRAEADEAGAVRLAVYSDGEQLKTLDGAVTPQSFVKQLAEKQQYPQMFRTANAGGTGGTGGGAGATGGGQTMTLAEWNATDPFKHAQLIKDGVTVVDSN